MNNLSINPQIRKKLNEKAAANKIPLNGIFELTPMCNMDCKMCFIRMSKEDMERSGKLYSADEWIDMGKQCVDRGMVFLLITGGEPFLRADFKKIYTELNKMGVMIAINSNGTLIDEPVVEWLKKVPPTRINITMYGGSNETYKKICGNPNGYSKVVRAIDLLIASGINVRINVSFTPENIADMEKIYEFAKKRKLAVKPAIYMFPPIRKADNVSKNIDETRLSAEVAGKALFNTKKCQMGERNLRTYLEFKDRAASVSKDLQCCEDVKEGIGCYAGQSFFWITWDGRMLPCGMMNDPVSFPFENGFSNSWEAICLETEKMNMPAECTECKNRPSCTVCMAAVKAEQDGRSKPEYLCKMTETYDKLCKEFTAKENKDKYEK